MDADKKVTCILRQSGVVFNPLIYNHLHVHSEPVEELAKLDFEKNFQVARHSVKAIDFVGRTHKKT